MVVEDMQHNLAAAPERALDQRHDRAERDQDRLRRTARSNSAARVAATLAQRLLRLRPLPSRHVISRFQRSTSMSRFLFAADQSKRTTSFNRSPWIMIGILVRSGAISVF